MVESAVERPVGRLRNTRQAMQVQELLRDADGFRTATELFDESRRRGFTVGLATIYRFLKLAAETGAADVVHSADGEIRYRLCGQADTTGAGHHHHLVCRVCGRSVKVDGPAVESWTEEVARAAGYTDVTHTVEIFGLCPEHSAKATQRRFRR